jgi:hypothetical protein
METNQVKRNRLTSSKKYPLAVLAAFGLCGPGCRAVQVRDVPADFTTITAAVNAATPGDVIRFSAPGTYPSTASTLTKNLSFTSTGGRAIITPPTGGGRVFTVGSGVTISFDHVTIDGGALTVVGTDRGAGILNNGNTTLTNCTLSNNSAAASGGAVYNSSGATLSMTNCTIAGNSVSGNANVGGAAISNAGTVALTNCTVAHNTSSGVAGGLDNRNDFSFTIKNTLVAGNTGGANPDLAGTLTSQDYNLVGNGTGATFSGATAHNQVGTGAAPIDARLGPLQDNGGNSDSVALLPGSPAIDAIAGSAPADFPPTDQRDTSRPVDGGDGDGIAEADIGAYEVATAPFDLYVSPQGDDKNTGVTPEQPMRSIGTAVSRIAISGIIHIAPGVYNEYLNLDKSVTIQGTKGRAAQTELASGNGTVVVVYPATTITLSDLSIVGGYATNFGLGYGGGVFNEGMLTMLRCTVSDNRADYSGGGVVNYLGGTMVLVDTSVVNNIADHAAGVENDGIMTMNRCAVYDNDASDAGGGIGNTGTLSIVNSTIADNQAVQGGGIYNMGRITLTNATVTGNLAVDGGGIANLITGAVSGGSSVIAGNSAATGPDVSGDYSSGQGYSFVGNTKDAGYGYIPNNGDQFGTPTHPLDARLGRLGDNGGYTPTMNPAANSPLIDAGPPPNDVNHPFPPTDQRGIARPIGAKSDIGAVEYQPIFLVTRTADDNNPGSLRWAIKQANTTNDSIIAFNIAPDGEGGGVKTIRLASALGGFPELVRQTFVDGWSQGGDSYTGPPLIEIDGEDVPTTFGLNLQAPGCVVRGLAINRFPNNGGGNAFGIGLFNNGTDAWIYGCYLGTDPSGKIARGNGQGGIWAGAGGALIGSNLDGVNDSAEGNDISANGLDGILVTSSDNTIAFNTIGMDPYAAIPLPNGTRTAFGGIRITGGSGNRITRNVIAYNHNLGIDLGGDGVTPTDPGDDDGGANALQNFPLITGVSTHAGQTTITGTLNSTPNSDFTVELFENDVTSSNFAQGEHYLISTTVHTDQYDNGAFSVSVPAGAWITATATDSIGDTSESSPPVPSPVPFAVADLKRALRLASGLAAYTSADSRLDVETGGASAGRVDMMDCARLARKVAGTDANP